MISYTYTLFPTGRRGVFAGLTAALPGPQDGRMIEESQKTEQVPETPHPTPTPPPPEVDVNPVRSQAERIIERLGGIERLMELLTYVGHPVAKSTIFRWTYPKERQGSGGLIPTHMWKHIFQCARCEGIILGPEDLDPRPMPKKIAKNEKVEREKARKVAKKRMRKALIFAKRRVEKLQSPK